MDIVWRDVVFVAKLALKGVYNIGQKTIGPKKGNVDGITEDKTRYGIQMGYVVGLSLWGVVGRGHHKCIPVFLCMH